MKFSRVNKAGLLIISSLILFLAPQQDRYGKVTFGPVAHKYLHNARIKELKTGKKASYEYNRKNRITDLVLSFNKRSHHLRRDDTRKYRISQSQYGFSKGKGALGKGCALFFKGKHQVIVHPVESLWLGSCGDLGSFTIEFRVKLLSVKDSIIISRIGYGSGVKRGFSISVSNERFVARFHKMFKRDDIKYDYTWLRTSQGLFKNKWYHVLVSFNRITGKLMLRVNNRESQVRYMTQSGNPYNGVYTPTFHNTTMGCKDVPPVFIGKGLSGYLDEMRISYIPYSLLKEKTSIAHHNYKRTGLYSRYPYNIEGVVTSPVYSFKGTGTRVTLFKWKQVLLKNSFVWMEFRISDKLFYPFDKSYRWYRIKNNQRNIYLFKKSDKLYLRGKYYQWRAHLIASPDGMVSPKLHDISLNFQQDAPPKAPIFVELRVTDEVIYISWKKNVDADIGGYKIYYGIMSKKYRGIISVIKGRKINNSFARKNYITIAITNKLIEENKQRDRRKLLDYPLIRNTVLYYFAVTAYDSYRPNTPYNHESDFSKEKSIRPFGGTEIK
jgi:hypothetical protein